MDKEKKKEKSIKEEDLQINLKNGLLIIEIKGIGGTSKDSDCIQISKIRHRRCKERKKFDVFALYIVNHQRYLPPLERKNPPFSENQIKDAESDERGLLTTWQLFNLFFEIENGIITRDEAKESLTEFGLVEFKPNGIKKLGKAEKVFKGGLVLIITLKNIQIKTGDYLLFKVNDRFEKTEILSIQKDNKPVKIIDNGEVGIQVDRKICKNAILWAKNQQE